MISIIVPLHNVENYLRRCIESILCQSYTDFELILVDDGSTDSSGEICDQFASNDKRISVIHQANQGQCEARNTGLENSRGSYVLFIDSDDVIHPSMLDVLYNALMSGDYDFSMVLGRLVPAGFQGKEFNDDNVDYSTSQSKVLTRDDCMHQLYGFGNKKIQYQVVWNKLYKRELLNGILFRNTASEDTDLNNRIYLRMNKAILVDAELYFWIQWPTSITHSAYGKRNVDRMNSYLMCLDDIPISCEFYRACCLESLYKVVLHSRYNSRNTSFFDETYSRSREVYHQTKHELIHCKLNTLKKLALLCFYHFPSLYALMMNMLGNKTKAN